MQLGQLRVPRWGAQSGNNNQTPVQVLALDKDKDESSKATDVKWSKFSYLLSRVMVAVGWDKSHNVYAMTNEKIRSSDKIIVLMGPTGVGKSNFIQSLTTKHLGIATATLSRGTHHVGVYRLLSHPYWKDNIILVDTPGFIDEFLSEYAVLKEVRQWMAKSKISHIDRLFYFENIDSPLTRGRVDCFKLFHAVCGQQAAHKTCLISTKWDFVKDASAHQIGQRDTLEMRANRKWKIMLDEHWKDFCDKGCNIFKFENTRPSAEDALSQALDSEPEAPKFSVEDLATLLSRMLMGEIAYGFLQERQATLIQEAEMMSRESLEVDRKKEERALSLKTIAGDIEAFISSRKLDSYEVVPLQEISIGPTDQIIMLLGSVGSGKSNFIQSLTKVNLDITHDSKSSRPSRDTPTIRAYRLLNHPTWTDRIIIIDTPGFMDPLTSDYSVLRDVRQWLRDNKLRGIDRVLCFHPIVDYFPSVSAELQSLGLLRSMCGVKVADRTCLITTRWDTLTSVTVSNSETTPPMVTLKYVAYKRLQELSSNTDYWKDFCDHGSPVLRFKNTADSAQQLLTTCLGGAPGGHLFAFENMTVHFPSTPLGKKIHDHLQQQRDALQLDVNRRQYLEAIQIEMHDFSTEEVEAVELPSDEAGSATDSDSEHTQSDSDYPSHVIEKAIWDLLLARPPAATPIMSILEIAKDDIIVLLMGSLGAGKTTFISSASGLDLSADTVAQNTSAMPIRCIKILFPDRSNNLVLADLPSFNDPLRSNEEVSRDIARWLADLYREGILISGAIHLYDITQERLDSEALETLKYFKAIIGESSLNCTALCSTGWNKIQGKKTADYAQKEREVLDRHFRPLLGASGSSDEAPYHFDTTTSLGARKSAIHVISSLVDGMNKPVRLQIQKEMVVLRRDFSETSIGQLTQSSSPDIFQDLQARIHNLQTEQELLQVEHAYAMAQGDTLLLEVIKSKLEEAEKLLLLFGQKLEDFSQHFQAPTQ